MAEYKNIENVNQQGISNAHSKALKARREASDAAEDQHKKLIQATGTTNDITRLEAASVQKYTRLLKEGDVGDSGIDPYDSTPLAKRKKQKQDKILSLSNQSYTNTLLERLIKTQDNQEIVNNTLRFQEQTTAYLTSINDAVKHLVQLNTPEEKQEHKSNLREDYKKDVTGMAKALTSLDMEKIGREFGKSLLDKIDSTGTFGLVLSGLADIKQSILDKTFGGQIKDMLQGQMLARLPKQFQVNLDKFKEDPVMAVQDVLNQMSYSKNRSVRTLGGMFRRETKPETSLQREKIDATAKASFDNKFYVTITKIIPDYLAAMTSALTGKEARHFDWNEQKYMGVNQMLYREMQHNSQGNMTTLMNNTMSGVNSAVMDVYRKDKTGKLRSRLKLDSKGDVIYNQNGMAEMYNANSLRFTMQRVILSGISLDSIRTGNIHSIVKTLSKAGKGLSPEQLAEVSDSVGYLQVLFASMDPRELRDMQDDIDSTRNSIHTRVQNGIFDWYSTEELEETERLFQDTSLSKDAIQARLRTRYYQVSPAFGQGGSTSTFPNRTQGRHAPEDILEPSLLGGKEQSIRQKVGATDTPLTSEQIDAKNKWLQQYATKDMYGYQPNDDLVDANLRATTEQERLDMMYRDMMHARTISDTEYQQWMTEKTVDGHTLSKDAISWDQGKKIAIYRKQLEVFRVFEDAGFTATAMAARSGQPVAYWKSKGYPLDPSDVHSFITASFDNSTNTWVASIDDRKMKDLNRSFGQGFFGEMETIANRNNRDIDFDVMDPGRTFSEITTDLFRDPKIAKMTGIGLGTAAGLGIGKILQKTGVIQSPKMGYLLGAIGAGLMTMERYQNALKGVLGEDGDIRGEHGYTNKEILMAKIMQKWLPSIGMGGKAMGMTMNLFRQMGPVGMIAGIPISLVAGGVGAFMGPKIMRWMSRILFADDGKGNKGVLKTIGKALKMIPFFDKYWTGEDTADERSMTSESLRRLHARLETQVQDLLVTGEANEKSPRVKAIREQQARILKYREQISKIKEDLTDDKKHEMIQGYLKSMFQELKGGTFIDKEEGRPTMTRTLGEEAQNTGSMDQARDGSFQENTLESQFEEIYNTRVEEKNQKNDVGFIGDLQFQNRKEIQERYLKEDIDALNHGKYGTVTVDFGTKHHTLDSLLRQHKEEDLKANPALQEIIHRYKVLRSLQDNDGSLKDTLESYMEEFFMKNEDAKEVLREIYIGDDDSIRDQLRGYGVWEQFYTDVIDAKFERERDRKQAYQAFLDKIEDETKRKEVAEYLQEKSEAATNIRNLYDEMLDISMIANRSMYRGKSQAELTHLSVTGLDDLLKSNLPFMTRLGKTIGISDPFGLADKMKRFLNEAGDTSEETDESETILQMLANMQLGGKGRSKRSSLGVRDASVAQYGDGSHDGKILKMGELGDFQFENGNSLSLAGCSIVAFHNCMVHLGLPTVGVPTMTAIANQHLTADGGVTSDFFTEMGQRLHLPIQIYTRARNQFTLKSLQSIAPSSTRGLIVLLENDYGGAHYVTITKVGSKTCTVNDPERHGLLQVSTGTILARSLEWITVGKSNQAVKSLVSNPTPTLESWQEKLQSLWKKSKVAGLVRKGQETIRTIKNVAQGIQSVAKNPLGALTKVFSTVEQKEAPTLGLGSNELIGILSGIKSTLQDILTRLSQPSGLPVVVVGNMSEVLDITDPSAAEEMFRIQNQQAKTDEERKALRRVKRIVGAPAQREDRKQKDQAEHAMIDLAEMARHQTPLIAGVSSGVGGKGASPLAEGAAEAATQAGGNHTFLGRAMETAVGLKIGQTMSKFLPGLGKFAVSAAIAAGAGYGLYKGGKKAWAGFKELFSTKEETDPEIDQFGNVLEYSDWNDRTNAITKIRDASAQMASMAIVIGKTSIGKMIKQAALKTVQNTTVQSGMQFVAKQASKGSAVVAGVAKLLHKVPTIMTKVFHSKAMNFVFNLPKVGPAIKSFLDAIILFFKKQGVKIGQAVAKVGGKEGAKSTTKQIPLIGLFLLSGLFAASFYEGYKKAYHYLQVPKELMEHYPMTRFKIALAKAMWENLPDILLCTFNTFTGGLSTVATIGVSAIVAVIRQKIGFPAFLHAIGIKRDVFLDKASGNEQEEDYEKKKIKELAQKQHDLEHEGSDRTLSVMITRGTTTTDSNETNQEIHQLDKGGMDSKFEQKRSLESETNLLQKGGDEVSKEATRPQPNILGNDPHIQKQVKQQETSLGEFGATASNKANQQQLLDLYRKSLFSGLSSKVKSMFGFGGDSGGYEAMDLSGVDWKSLSTSNITFTKDAERNKRTQFAAELILKYADEFDVDPAIALAQWAFESSWGTKVSGKNNYFGIKADGSPNAYWDGSKSLVWTKEHVNGKTGNYKLAFRDYKSWDDGVRDYLRLIRRNYPGTKTLGSRALIHNPTTKLSYATAPDYIAKIGNQANTFRTAMLKSAAYAPTEGSDPKLDEQYRQLDARTKLAWSSARSNGLHHPMGKHTAEVSSVFGDRSALGPSFKGSKDHGGIDFAGAQGTPVYATKDGTILESTKDWGKIVLQDEDNPRNVSKYLHLSERYVQPGDHVKAGQPIGEVGGIGAGGRHAYDPHLHFERIVGGVKKDPFLELGLPPNVIRKHNSPENIQYINRHGWIKEQLEREEAKRTAQAQTNVATTISAGLQKGGPDMSETDRRTPVSHSTIDYDKAKAKQQELHLQLTQIRAGEQKLEAVLAAIQSLGQQLASIAQLLQQGVTTMQDNSNKDLLSVAGNARI